MRPQVSVIVPVYNVAPYLGACLEALCRQTYAEIEIICVDDASSDSSAEILAEASKHDKRIKIIRHSVNRGLSAARNTGLDIAIAPWVLFVDSDDLVSKRICERTLDVAKSTNADVVFFTYAVFTDGNSPPPEPLVTKAIPADRNWLLHRPAFAWTKLVRMDLLQSKKIKFPEGLCFEDVPVHWRLALESSHPVFLDEALIWYRQRTGSITHRKDWTRADGLKIYDLVREQLRQSGHWFAHRETFLAAEMMNFANTHAYYALANPGLIGRVRREAQRRMTAEHWSLVLTSSQLNGWQRDYIIACCRPKGVALVPSFIVSIVRQAFRDPVRRFRNLFR
jgi:glycosyltransferase involved in cell wall biosynthesis